MSKKNSDTNSWVRRQKDAPPPSYVEPLNRQAKPEKSAQKPLLDHVTLQEALTEEQLQPLSKREKPQLSENVFPSPLPSQRRSGAREYTQLRVSTATPSSEPMLRHTVRTGQRADWKYTSSEQVTPAPNKNAPADAKPVKRNGESVSATVVKMPIDKKPFILGAIAIFLALVIILGCVFGIVPAASGKKPATLSDRPALALSDRPASKDAEILSPVDPSDPALKNAFDHEYAGVTAVGFSGDVVGTVDRDEVVKPVKETTNEGTTFGNTSYPTYGYTLRDVIGAEDDKVALRNQLIDESAYLCAWGTAGANRGGEQTPDKYTVMDRDGWLYQFKNGERIHSLVRGATENVPDNYRRLYKHTFAEGLYLGDVSDDEPRVVKQVTLRPRGYGSYSVTGVYAPAGEVIKVEIGEKDMNSTGGLTIHIGQALYNGQANNIWASKNQMSRVPHLLTTLVLDKTTTTYDEANRKYVGYVGSFLGGPLYIRNTSAKFTATITGGVEYPHIILGYTTKTDYEESKKFSAPYFDLEVWDRGVLHSGPKRYAQSFSYEDLYKAAVLWDKVASVTTTGSNQGIVFLYDPFVAAGAAVAFPGRSSVNCPLGWMASSLNYNAIVTSGSWGNFHEYHHNFQGYGVGGGGEVTNNGLTLVSYALFTKISSKRGMGSFGAQGLGGWNNYTSATFAMEEVLKIARPDQSPGNGNQGLALYANLLHNFGADAYMNAKVAGGGQSYAAYMNAWQKVTHNNMYYYFNEILRGTGISDNADPSYPVFVPVSCVYQTGRSYMYDGKKKYFTTMQPYVIPAHKEFNIDLSRYSAPNGQYASGSIVMPEGFTYRIKSVTEPSNGKIEVVDGYNLKYTPDPANKSLRSGQILVTLEIVKTDGAFKVDDIDLILEFEQSFESNKMTLERTTYTFDDAHMYSDVVAAYDAKFAGYASKVESDHSNPTQNCNTDVWLVPDTEAGRSKFPNAKEQEIAKPNQIIEVKGKLYFAEAGKYRIYLRGRVNCAMYYSTDGGKTYKLGATVKNGSGDKFYTNDPNTYVDVEVEAESWIYYKSAFITQTATQSTLGYMGIGVSQWTQTMFTMTETYHKADNTAVDSPDDEAYAYTKVTYNDLNGNAVAYSRKDKDGNTTQYFRKSGSNWVTSDEKEVSALTESRLIAPASASYVNAYRSNYQFPDNNGFESEYFYVRGYNCNYTDNELLSSGQTLISQNYTNHSWSLSSFPLSNLTDGNRNTFIHTNNWGNSASKPLEFVIDLGEAKTVNRMTIYTQNRPNGDWYAAKTFTLEGSLDGENFFTVGTFENVPRNSLATTVNFEDTTFRYYRLVITGSTGSHVIIGEIEMWHVFEIIGNGANQVAPNNDSLIFTGQWHSESIASTFGYAFVGESGSKVKFEMIGTRLAILTSTLYGNNFDVYIDGKKCPSIAVKSVTDEYGITYISQKLDSATHKVEIRCTGTVCFDSFAIYNEK